MSNEHHNDDFRGAPMVSPLNSLPIVIIILALVLIGIEIMFLAASKGMIGGDQGIGWRLNAVQDYAFSPMVMDQIVERGNRSSAMLRRFVTYPFIHISFVHALFATALLAALGKFVGERFHWLALIVLLIVSTVVGAAVYGFIGTGRVGLIGAYPAVYGLIGAYTYLMWLDLGRTGENRLKAFRLIAMLMGLQLFYGLAFSNTPTWIADLAGFFVGLIFAPILAPGGMKTFLARTRQRN